MQIKFISSPPAQTSWLQKAVALLVFVMLASLVLLFSALLLPVVVVLVALGAAYFWWKTRAVRKQFREMEAQMRDFPRDGMRDAGEIVEGEIVEGEVVRVRTSLESK